MSERVRELVEPVLAGRGIEVVDVQHAGASLRVFVDRPGGIDLDTVSTATEIVSGLLDTHDPVPGRYTLEVSSPGIERPLRTPEHFRRAVGSAVSIRTHAHVEGERRIEGILAAADDEGVVVSPEGAGAGAEHRLGYGDIERARTRFEWGPAPKPTGPGKKKAAAR